MTKSSMIYFVLTVVMTVYLVISLSVANSMAEAAPCKGIVYEVLSKSTFVNAEAVDRDLGGLQKKSRNMSMNDISLKDIEERLSKLSVIENVNCYRLNNDQIKIDIEPMTPLARVFESDRSYYINREGKELTANAIYKIDVPVIIGTFKAKTRPVDLVPLIDKINGDSIKNQLVTAFKIEKDGDIILIPSIVGHVINFGDASKIDDKFERITAFYRDVMPVKGWNYYDTISVKFSGQVIGKIAGKTRAETEFEYASEDYVEDVDMETMSAADTLNVQIIRPHFN